MKSDGFTIYRSQIKALRCIDAETFKDVILALADYWMDDTEPACTGTALAMFELVRPLVDSKKRDAENGAKGGRPKKENPGYNPAKTPVNTPVITPVEGASKQKEKREKRNENREERNENREIKEILSDKSDPVYPYAEVIGYLNQKTGANYQAKSKDTRKHIKARFDEGFTLDDFKTVIDKKVAEWKDDEKMSGFLRPSTLFGTKFESYLNQQTVKGKPKNRFNNFPQRDYDFAEFEKQLLNASLGGGQ